jgi:hypothetical protein
LDASAAQTIKGRLTRETQNRDKLNKRRFFMTNNGPRKRPRKGFLQAT